LKARAGGHGQRQKLVGLVEHGTAMAEAASAGLEVIRSGGSIYEEASAADFGGP
jgi:hypothetical protein